MNYGNIVHRLLTQRGPAGAVSNLTSGSAFWSLLVALAAMGAQFHLVYTTVCTRWQMVYDTTVAQVPKCTVLKTLLVLSHS